MRLTIYQVDAFTDRVFSGNPAAVCPLSAWLNDTLLQQIAMENNLAETAFYVRMENGYEIRWFTPTVEVDLCGHATLATALVLFDHENHDGDTIHFSSPRSGALTVRKNGVYLSLNFPTDELKSLDLFPGLGPAFDIMPQQVYKGKTDYMLVYESEREIRDLQPDFEAISLLDGRGVIVTAPGDTVDFVSRFFAPQSGINEDPVTGSAHTSLIPYWAERLGKDELVAMQLSARRGFLQCRFLQDRVEISGQGKLYMKGQIFMDD